MPFLMRVPRGSYRFGTEKPFAGEASLVEQALCPVLEWTLEPAINGHTEAHFGPLDQVSRNVAVKYLP